MKKIFSISSTYNPFRNNIDLKMVSENFFIGCSNFINDSVISVETGLIPTPESFLTEVFTVNILDTNGNILQKLRQRIGETGNNNYPKEDEIIWFDIEGMQGDYWINDVWENKILNISGYFEMTAITSKTSALNLAGCIIAFSCNDLNKLPPNSMHCNGDEVSRTIYSNLFNVIGNSWGHGDGSTTFNLPDGRSGTLKGIGNGILTDDDRENRFQAKTGGNAGDLVGSYQRHAIEGKSLNHSHTIEYILEGNKASGSGDYGNLEGVVTSNNNKTIYTKHNGLIKTKNTELEVGNGNSTRDNNLGVHWIIFY